MIVAPRGRFQGGLNPAGLEAPLAQANAGVPDAQSQPFQGESLLSLCSVHHRSQGFQPNFAASRLAQSQICSHHGHRSFPAPCSDIRKLFANGCPLEQSAGVILSEAEIFLSRVLKNSDVRDESKFESEQGDSPRSWAGSPASGDQRCTDSKVPHPERVVTAHRALLRSLEPAGLPARHGSSRLGNARAEPQSRPIRIFQHPANAIGRNAVFARLFCR